MSPAIVDRERHGVQGAGDVYRRKLAVRPDEAVPGAVRVGELPDDPSAVVDAVRNGGSRAGHVELRHLPALEQIPTRPLARQERADHAVVAHDLAALVDLVDLGPRDPGQVDPGDPAAPVAQEAGLALGREVLAHDHAPVIDGTREELHAWVGSLEAPVPPVVEDERGDL